MHKTNSSGICPFPRNTVFLDNVSEIKQRRPIKVWVEINNAMTRLLSHEPDERGINRRLTKSKKDAWQNKVRYEIVDRYYGK